MRDLARAVQALAAQHDAPEHNEQTRRLAQLAATGQLRDDNRARHHRCRSAASVALVHARVADPQERARLWPNALATYDGYRATSSGTHREIPLVVLEPRV